jgi:hypothetical protein
MGKQREKDGWVEEDEQSESELSSVPFLTLLEEKSELEMNDR